MSNFRNTRSLQVLACVLGRSRGLRVVFDNSAETASTDGRTITLPVIPNLGTEEQAVLVEGLVDHEAMHCRFTDFSVLNDPVNQKQPRIVFSWANLIEDVWGEREQSVIFPGCLDSIKKSMDVMIKLGMYGGPAIDENRVDAVRTVTNWLINEMLGRWYNNRKLKKFAAKDVLNNSDS